MKEYDDFTLKLIDAVKSMNDLSVLLFGGYRTPDWILVNQKHISEQWSREEPQSINKICNSVKEAELALNELKDAMSKIELQKMFNGG